ncbi:MAG: hypothetical protein ABR529_16275 [Actinomycetota bacterium]
MAIKGKKKSQTRGSQARRRPASAPRPIVAARRTPWYRTERGRVVLIGLAVAIVALVWWAVAGARSRAADLERRRDVIESYSDRVRALLQGVRPAAQGMSQTPTKLEGQGPGPLGKSAQTWIEDLRVAETQAVGIFPAPAVSDAHELFARSVSLLLGAAETYALVPDAPKDLRTRLLERAAQQRDGAVGVWVTATRVLDAERAVVELLPSGLGAPATGPAAGRPSLPAPPGDGEGGGDGTQNDGGG